MPRACFWSQSPESSETIPIISRPEGRKLEDSPGAVAEKAGCQHLLSTQMKGPGGKWTPANPSPSLPETFHLTCTPFFPPRSSSARFNPHPWLQEPPRMFWSTCNPPADRDGSGCWQKWRKALNPCSRKKVFSSANLEDAFS